MTKKQALIILIGLFVLVMWLLAQRFFYGAWNPFQPPEQVQCHGRRYTRSRNNPTVLLGPNEPTRQICVTHILLGKTIYDMPSDDDVTPTIIYIRHADGTYQEYALSGGP